MEGIYAEGKNMRPYSWRQKYSYSILGSSESFILNKRMLLLEGRKEVSLLSSSNLLLINKYLKVEMRLVLRACILVNISLE